MTGLAVLVVDDEPLARRRLVRLLGKLDWVGRIEQAADVAEARLKVLELQPDILLLDILMPGGSGFDVLQQLGPEPPIVIFVTAFDHHALRAFEANAVDYLTKPIEPGRFGLAMDRARAAIDTRHQADRIAEL
ncbi:partial Transcriptional regulatory protein BtsR, partial [Anaerolineae bacterium]